jgi:hypothetical protein
MGVRRGCEEGVGHKWSRPDRFDAGQASRYKKMLIRSGSRLKVGAAQHLEWGVDGQHLIHVRRHFAKCSQELSGFTLAYTLFVDCQIVLLAAAFAVSPTGSPHAAVTVVESHIQELVPVNLEFNMKFMNEISTIILI